LIYPKRRHPQSPFLSFVRDFEVPRTIDWTEGRCWWMVGSATRDKRRREVIDPAQY
jgi:hypothetical protein